MITASVVLYKNSEEEILSLLECVENSPIDYFYVVDQSPEESRRRYFADKDNVEYIFKNNEGYGVGHNVAIRRLGNSDYHIILNPDIVFSSETITFLRNYMELQENEDVGLTMPKIINPEGEVQHLCKLLPTPKDIFVRKFGTKKMKKRIDRLYALTCCDYNHEMNVPILSGCFMFFRSSVLKSLQGFDTRFFLYFEDFDLSRRAYQISRNMYVPEVSVIHNHRAGHRTSMKLSFMSLISTVKYFNKWGWLFDNQRRKINDKTLKTYLVY